MTEARWIAAEAVRLHDEGAKWSEIAVLCRTSRLFFLLQQAFEEHEVPVEILGLAGLLKLPVIVEVLAYARAVLDPLASVELARILMGPRYRVGYKDLALVASLAKRESIRLRSEDEEEGEATPFLFAEALERLDEVEGLSDEGRDAAGWSSATSCGRSASRPAVPSGEFLSEIIRRTGILTELDADTDPAAAQATKRNLARVPGRGARVRAGRGRAHAPGVPRLRGHGPAPGQGGLGAGAALGRGLGEGHDDPRREGPRVRSRLRARAWRADCCPIPRIQQNPAERGKSLDFELRGDAAILPAFDGVLSHFKEELKAQEVIEERRTAYVALTRARRTLFVSCAHWYGENLHAKGPSDFFDELAAWGAESGGAAGRHGARAGRRGEPAAAATAASLVKPWPEPALRPEADAAFPTGWRAAALQVADAGGVEQAGLVESLDDEGRRAFEALAAERRSLAVAPARARAPPRAGSVDPRPAHRRLGQRRDRLRHLPEALLLDAASARSPGSADPPRGSAPRSTAGSSAARSARAR